MTQFDSKKWLEQYNLNYSGQSKEAKELEKYVKPTFKGNLYIPWAVMERLTYQQDPEAIFNKNGIVSTPFEVLTRIKGEETLATIVAHFVEVTLTFLGKQFIETYPIQDKDYSAPKVYDQNMVNKAYQRALAKVASRATGIGLSLYENGELQFEEVAPPTVVPPTVTKKKTVEEPTTVEETPKIVINQSTIDEIIAIIKDEKFKERVSSTLKTFNHSLIKTYGFTISTEDTVEELTEKLNKIQKPDTFKMSLERNLDK